MMDLPIRPIILNNVRIKPATSSAPTATATTSKTEAQNTESYINSKNSRKSAAKESFSSTPAIDLGKLLLIACRDGNYAKARELISAGAPFATDWLGMSALHFAAQNNHVKICELLIRGGHNTDLKTKVDRTPLHLAVYEGHQEIVELFCEQNADLNIKDMLRMTPLHWAIEKHHKRIVYLLVKNGALVEEQSKFGKSAFNLAIESQQDDLLPQLERARERILEREMRIAEQLENETAEAVNSITIDMDETEEIIIDDDDDEEIIEAHIDLDDDEEEDEDEIETLNMLRNLKSMVEIGNDSNDDDDYLTSALQNGRKLILSEGGKLALNETKKRHLTECNLSNILNIKRPMYSSSSSYKHQQELKQQQETRQIEETKHREAKKMEEAKRQEELRKQSQPKKQQEQPKRIILDNIVDKTKIKPMINCNSNNVQVISMETFKKMYGADAAKQLNFPKSSSLPQTSNVTKISNITKVANISKMIANKPIIKLNNSNVQTININSLNDIPKLNNINDNDDDDDNESAIDYENIIDLQTDDIIEEETEAMNEIENLILSYKNETKVKETPVINAPILDTPSICKELYELRKLIGSLRQELEATKKENQQYKIRIDNIEKLIRKK